MAFLSAISHEGGTRTHLQTILSRFGAPEGKSGCLFSTILGRKSKQESVDVNVNVAVGFSSRSCPRGADVDLSLLGRTRTYGLSWAHLPPTPRRCHDVISLVGDIVLVKTLDFWTRAIFEPEEDTRSEDRQSFSYFYR